MANRPLLKIELAGDLTPEEQEVVERLVAKAVEFAPGQDMATEGERPTHATVILEGLACRYRALPNGSRQIISFQIAGDWADLHSYFIRTMDHSLGAITRCRVAQVPHPVLREVIETYPRLGQALWRDTMVDASVFREWVVNIGRRDAYERVAHLLCELHARLDAVGLTNGYSYELPLTQADLADSVGVSTVHANRVLQKLRGEGLISFGGKSVVIHDWSRLIEVAGFNPAYLHLHEGPPTRGPSSPVVKARAVQRG
jgi:CRP-like cAMP-binding protein